MAEWETVQKEGLPVLTWWEMMVKPGIRKIAMERSKEINQNKRAELNLLLLRQAYLIRKIKAGHSALWRHRLTDLVTVQSQIQRWYRQAAEKVQHQSRVNEFQVSEQTRIYHHQIHKKHLKKSSILKLQTDTGLLYGHDLCSEFPRKTSQ